MQNQIIQSYEIVAYKSCYIPARNRKQRVPFILVTGDYLAGATARM